MLPQCNNHAPVVGTPATHAQTVLLHTLKLMTLTQHSPGSPWPCPRRIAHHGSGQLAAENTLALGIDGNIADRVDLFSPV